VVKESKAKAAAMSHHHKMRCAAYMRHFSIVVFHYWSTFVLKDGGILVFKMTNNVTNIKNIHFLINLYSLIMQDSE
jgi:hypothetical protein